ncbi:hypothetical protein [Rhodococcus aetherivorans]|nr:hypothetical protein [Rhodococcus aetherivorans]MBC2592483.1 hypothetical protein [Rhodococcus aetherivorans]
MSAIDRLPAGLTMLIDATRTGQVPGGDVVRASQNYPARPRACTRLWR